MRVSGQRTVPTVFDPEARRTAPLTVSVDPGIPDYSTISDNFTRIFPKVNMERILALHEGVGWTSIEIFVNLVSIGGGIVAAEMLKEIAKDLWRALKGTMAAA